MTVFDLGKLRFRLVGLAARTRCLLFVLLIVCSSTWAALASAPDEKELDRRARAQLHEHPFRHLAPNSTHEDSLRAIGYYGFLPTTPGGVHQADPACLALVEVTAIHPPDHSLFNEYSDWEPIFQRNVSWAALVNVRILESLGCRDMQLATPSIALHTVYSTTRGTISENGGTTQALYPGMQLYAVIQEVAAFRGSRMLYPCFGLGEPGEPGSLFELDVRVRPLMETFGRDLETGGERGGKG